MKKAIILSMIICVLSSCNSCSRNFGGTQTVELEPKRRLVTMTWKDSDLWILTKEDTTTKPSTFHFKEKSDAGIMNGEVIIIEK